MAEMKSLDQHLQRRGGRWHYIRRIPARYRYAIVGNKPIKIYPGPIWENGNAERFSGILRHEILDAE